MALDTHALNAEEQVCALLPKAVARAATTRAPSYKVTSDSAVQAKLKTMTVLGQAGINSSLRRSKIKKVKERS